LFEMAGEVPMRLRRDDASRRIGLGHEDIVCRLQPEASEERGVRFRSE
jgi:hypothetical protein